MQEMKFDDSVTSAKYNPEDVLALRKECVNITLKSLLTVCDQLGLLLDMSVVYFAPHLQRGSQF